jgi:oxygen-independent coproporphyrinogen-3 oxidase
MTDIQTALSFEPTHFSWYQLTIEPNTLFYHQTPVLPVDDMIWDMQMAGQQLIRESGFHQYEVSAYAQPQKNCRHNLNYWEFGDYLGIGAGAHSKITIPEENSAIRFSQVRNPKDYLNPVMREKQNNKTISDEDLIFEFMLNALRLTDGVSVELFQQRTGIAPEKIKPQLHAAKQRGLLLDNDRHIQPSEDGKKYLNDLMSIFLP